MTEPSTRLGELTLSLTSEGAGLYLQRGGLRLSVERTWGGQTRAGVFYRAEF